MAISFEEARACVLREVKACVAPEEIWLADAAGRVLAEDVAADRDYPPFDRSARDGFAVRAADLPGMLRVTGEIRAGAIPNHAVGEGEAIEIMTGAPMPLGADAVVMVEHTRRDGALSSLNVGLRQARISRRAERKRGTEQRCWIAGGGWDSRKSPCWP